MIRIRSVYSDNIVVMIAAALENQRRRCKSVELDIEECQRIFFDVLRKHLSNLS